METAGGRLKVVKKYVREKLTPIHREELARCFQQAWNEDATQKTSPDLWIIAVLAFLETGPGAELRGIAREALFERSEGAVSENSAGGRR
jgi:hypothetical protein